MSKCTNCTKYDDCRTGSGLVWPCGAYVPKNPMTHADRIRAMSDEELAGAMMGVGSMEDKIHFCQNLQECDELLETMDGVPEEKCMGCLLQWLQQPVEEAQNK